MLVLCIAEIIRSFAISIYINFVCKGIEGLGTQWLIEVCCYLTKLSLGRRVLQSCKV